MVARIAFCSLSSVSRVGPDSVTAVSKVHSRHGWRTCGGQDGRGGRVRMTVKASTTSSVSTANDEDLPAEDAWRRSKLKTFLSMIVFGTYFSVVLLLTRRVIFVDVAVYDKIVAMALAIALPDMARFSFVEVGKSSVPMRVGSGLDTENEGPGGHLRFFQTVGVRRRFPALVTNLMKLTGFLVAALVDASIGAIVIMGSEILFNALVHFGWISSSRYRMRAANRIPIILLNIVALGTVICCALSLSPLNAATTFFSILVGYWLSKYDIDLFFEA